jgi:hypothetical protein
MSPQVRIKPGKPVSLLGMVVGLIFVALGLAVIIPVFGPFGVVWTCVAGAIAVFYAYNFLSARGASAYDVDVTGEDFDTRLRKLEKLRQDGLISTEEFERKRSELMRERW